MSIAFNELRAGRGVNGSSFFVDGMSSAADPIFISDRSYRHGQNVLHRGGVIRTRPGYTQIAVLADGKLQGLTYFRPIEGEGTLVAAVSGFIYVSPYPFTSWTQLANPATTDPLNPVPLLYPFAERVYFSSTTSSAERQSDGTIIAVEPQRTLIMQDGGYTRAAFWNSVTSGNIDPTLVADGAGNVLTKGTPLGGAICWSGNRLWVAQNNKVFAGDISNPYSFTENEYAADGGFFLFDDDVVALAEIPSIDSPILLVFTKTRTYRLLSGIQDRSTWKSTMNFQSVFLPDIGCTSSRGVVAQKGVLWWMCQTGLTNLNAAVQAKISTKLVPQDTAMAISKFNLSPDLSSVALGNFENFVFCSVPYADRFNLHTWVLDTSVTAEVDSDSTESWAGVWSGTRPVEWATGVFAGVPRVFHASTDLDGKNRVWEAFSPLRQDNNQSISCFVETKTHVDFSQKATGLDRKQFMFAETGFCDIVGNVDVQVYWAGLRGKYKLIATHHLVSTDSVASGITYNNTNGVASNQGQIRVLRTPEIKQDPDMSCSTRGVESDNADWIDVGFSLLITWTGQASLRSYRIFSSPFNENDVGSAQVTEAAPKIVLGSVCAIP